VYDLIIHCGKLALSRKIPYEKNTGTHYHLAS
jgi:hypothetical protein